jgi:hypothetical protein
MATLKKIKAAVEAIGGTLDGDAWLHTRHRDGDHGPGYDFTVCAPEGKRWKCADLHMMVYADEQQRLSDDVVNGALADIAFGLEACDDPECDYCCDEVENVS